MKKFRTIIFGLLIGYGFNHQVNAYTPPERSEFNRVELVSISLKPTVLVIRDEFGDTQTIRLIQGAKITSNGKDLKAKDLKTGDVFYIATKKVVSNIIVSDQVPSDGELDLHKVRPKLIEVTIDKNKLKQSTTQFLIAITLAGLGFIALILVFIIKSTKKSSKTDDEKSNRRSN